MFSVYCKATDPRAENQFLSALYLAADTGKRLVLSTYLGQTKQGIQSPSSSLHFLEGEEHSFHNDWLLDTLLCNSLLYFKFSYKNEVQKPRAPIILASLSLQRKTVSREGCRQTHNEASVCYVSLQHLSTKISRLVLHIKASKQSQVGRCILVAKRSILEASAGFCTVGCPWALCVSQEVDWFS